MGVSEGVNEREREGDKTTCCLPSGVLNAYHAI